MNSDIENSKKIGVDHPKMSPHAKNQLPSCYRACAWYLFDIKSTELGPPFKHKNSELSEVMVGHGGHFMTS